MFYLFSILNKKPNLETIPNKGTNNVLPKKDKKGRIGTDVYLL